MFLKLISIPLLLRLNDLTIEIILSTYYYYFYFDSAATYDYVENRYNIMYSLLEVFLDYTQQNKYNIRN